jgi:hypothetical protein
VIYWFKYEPVTWRVLSRDENKVLLLSNIILDCQHFYHSNDNRTIDGKKVFANNYKESDIRTWINNDFYNMVFNEDEKAKILTTEVDNSSEQSYNPFSYEPNPYSCENTNDKMFMLSSKEIQTKAYGFREDGGNDPARRFNSTDYAKAQGSSTYYLLRTPNAYDIVAGCVGHVTPEGNTRSVNSPDQYIKSYAVPTKTTYGTLPAMWVTL